MYLNDVYRTITVAGKETDMTAVRIAFSYKKHIELQSSFDYLDRLFVRSYKAKKHGYVIS